MPPTFNFTEESEVPWEKKCWGYVWHLYASDQTAVSFLTTEEGFRCSKHMHNHRANMFAVLAGKIEIEEWQFDHMDINSARTVLTPGQIHTVPSGVYHRFRVLQSGMVVEVYWVDAKVSIDDIERLDEGGADDS